MQTVRLIFVWLWVAIPLGWGMWQSIQKSMPLFQHGTVEKSAGSTP